MTDCKITIECDSQGNCSVLVDAHDINMFDKVAILHSLANSLRMDVHEIKLFALAEEMHLLDTDYMMFPMGGMDFES